MFVGVKFFSNCSGILDVFHYHHHHKREEEDLPRGRDATRGGVPDGHGMDKDAQAGGVAGGPGTPESRLVSKGGFQDERCFWPSVPKLSRFGHGVALEGAFQHPARTKGIGAHLEKPMVPWAARGPDSEPLPAHSFWATSRDRAQHTSLFAAPLWVARASLCPSTIVVAVLLWGKWGRKPRSRPAAPRSQLPALPNVPGEAALSSCPVWGGWRPDFPAASQTLEKHPLGTSVC